MSMTYNKSVVFSGYSTNKTDHHDITEIVLKVALNTINLNIKISPVCRPSTTTPFSLSCLQRTWHSLSKRLSFTTCIANASLFRKRCTLELSEWLLINAISSIFHPYHGENKFIFNEIRFVLDQHAYLDLTL